MAGIKYYPLSRVQTGLTTSGNLYTLEGKPYSGPYYLTYDGKAFSGPNPACGSNQLLLPVSFDTKAQKAAISPLRGKGTKIDQSIRQAVAAATTAAAKSTATLKQLIPYYPVVLDSDYSRGYFTRYFAKKVNINGYILEISYTDWATVKNKTDIQFEDYEVLDMFWQVKGPAHDKRVSQYQVVGGVYDTNKRVTEGKAKGFNGLIEYVGGDYIKYAVLTD